MWGAEARRGTSHCNPLAASTKYVPLHWLLQNKERKADWENKKRSVQSQGPPSLSMWHASLTISSSGPFVFDSALNAWLVSKFVAFLLHNLKFKISTLEMILFFFNDKMEKLYRFELKKKKKKDADHANLFICENTQNSRIILFMFIFMCKPIIM